jgi:phenylalanine-4-hydroxylase
MFTDFTIRKGEADRKDEADRAPPPGAGPDWTIPQNWERFTPEEHGVWDRLFARQQEKLAGRVVRAFADGLELLRLSRPGIPRLEELNERLFRRTGWTIVSVPGLVPDEVFFRHLSRRQFPAGNFIRPASQLDYLEEPDLFHDLFGHVPMLADARMAAFMQTLGDLGLATSPGADARISRLYWYTVEFGLAREAGELRIYGAGLASSFGEAGFALESPQPRRLPFDVARILRTRYRSDCFQDRYFVIDHLDELPELVSAALRGSLPGEPIAASRRRIAADGE